MTFCQDLTKVAVAVCDALGTNRAATVKEAVLGRNWTKLVSLTTHPSDYQCAHDYFKDAVATELFRKLDGLDTGIDLHQKAIDVFWASERACYSTNQRFSRFARWITDGIYICEDGDPEVQDFLFKARSVIRTIIGPIPQTLSPGMGKGATFHDKGFESTIAHKFSSRPTRTANAWWVEYLYSTTAWGFATLDSQARTSAPEIVRGNRFTSVPKDSSKNRGICVEPSLNLAYQLPVGGLFKARLREAGIDLWTGQEKHRLLARRASVDGSLATIDLSNASDTIATSVVKALLPTGWFDLLSDLRSPLTRMDDGSWVKLEKFSSMGNGFTFELETLIFLSICCACAKMNGYDWESEIRANRISVYGDDIIVPVEYAQDVLTALQFFGFTPNRKKTFIEGPFRESCGGDFFNGVDVRPFYLKELPNEPSQWITLANGLRRLDIPDNVCSVRRLGLNRAWHLCLAPIPSDIRRLRGPRILGDLVIHDDPINWSVRLSPKDPNQRQVLTWKPQSRKLSLRGLTPGAMLACALFGVPSTGISPRDSITGYKQRWSPLLEVSEL